MLITHSNIGCDRIQNIIAVELVKQDNFVYLTVTMNLNILITNGIILLILIKKNIIKANQYIGNYS